MAEKNMIEQAEAREEAEAVAAAEQGEAGEGDLGSLFGDTVRSITKELQRIEEAEGDSYNSAYESYAVLTAAIEAKAAEEKDLKEILKKLWAETKAKNNTSTAAYFAEIERVARQSAMAWMRVGAIAKKAEASL